jgi:hypothetical protein
MVAVKCNLTIEGERIKTIIDSGASTNIITDGLRKRLNLTINEPSTTIFKMVNSKGTPSLGKTTIKITIKDIMIPVKAQVVDTQEEELILGNEILVKLKGTIDYEKKTLTVKQNNTTIEIPIIYTRDEEQEYEEMEEQEAYSSLEYSPTIYLAQTSKEEKEIQEHLIMGDITLDQKLRVVSLLRKYQDRLAMNQTKIGRTSKITHKINTGDHPPISQKYYKVTEDKRRIIKEEIEKMEKEGIIQETKGSCPWSSPVVIVTKKDGSPRFCVDYRKINDITITDAYPLPRIDELLEKYRTGKWFTSLDLASGYWQVEMDPQDKSKTAFTCHLGLYEFNVMPFGLKNAPPTFQRLMNKILREYLDEFVIVYIDDLLIYSKTFEEHIEHLRKIFDKLREANLMIKLKKCKFCMPNIEFLGHVVGRDGLQPDPTKIEKMENLERPTDLRTLRGVLGLFSYYRKFVKDFSSIAKPMTELLKKEVEFIWEEKQQKAFNELKRRLTIAPILGYPDYNKPFILFTDASGKGLGAVLSQNQDNKEIVIAYASRSLNKAEQNYPITEQEALAVVWAIEHFHKYLIPQKFTVVTDHSALTTLMKTHIPKGRRARWIMKLQQFNFEIKHRSGRSNKNADALSRLY